MKTPKNNQSKQSMNRPRKFKVWLEIVLVIAAILIIPLFFAIRSQTGQPVNPQPTAGTSIPPTSSVATPAGSTPINEPTPIVLRTAVPVVATGKEPPACTFPLAQTTTVVSTPANYTFSAPKVVLNAPKGNNYSIAEWLPDNQQFLITEDLLNVETNGNLPQQSISLFNPETGKPKVVAIRNEIHNEPPVWDPGLNAVVYPAINYTSIDKAQSGYKPANQMWVSYGNPASAQKLGDNLPQLALAVKPDGSQTLYFSGKQLSKRNASMQAISSTPSFDPTQWDYATSRRNALPVAYEMAWQPGTSLIFLYSDAFIDGGGYTFILNADTGRVCELNFGGWALEGHWSSDGRYLAIIRAMQYYSPIPSSDLALLDTATGKLTTLVVTPQETQGQHLYDFAWAPDKRHLLVLRSPLLSQDNQGGGDFSRLYLVDIVTGQSVNVVPGYKSIINAPQSLAWSPDGSKLVIDCTTPGVDHICLISVKGTGK